MKIIKWIGIILGSLIIIAASVLFFQIRKADKLLNRKLEISPVSMDIPEDSFSIAIGKKWVVSTCAECHGQDLGGKIFIDDPAFGTLYTPNITRGEGGIAYYTDENWLASIRHGVSPSGKPLLIMPSKDFAMMRAEDVGGIIAYLKTVPPVDRTNEISAFTPFFKILLSVGALGEAFGADAVNHQAPVPPNVSNESPKARGEYLSVVLGCQSCHGESLSGKKSDDPNAPPATNLTPGGNLINWSYDDFDKFMNTGVTSEGKKIDPKYMPWKAYSSLPNQELESIFTYLKSMDEIETTL